MRGCVHGCLRVCVSLASSNILRFTFHIPINICITDSESVRSVSEFLEEATIMHNFDHPNVLSLLGVVIDDNKPYVIMPLMENGDLRVFIGNRERVQTTCITIIQQVYVCYATPRCFASRVLNCQGSPTVKLSILIFRNSSRHCTFYEQSNLPFVVILYNCP